MQPDTIVPREALRRSGAGNPQAWNRYGYVGNNPINAIDPSGNRECDIRCQMEYQRVDPLLAHYGEATYEWDVANQRDNVKTVETIGMVSETIVSILIEPADWAITINDCITGNCNIWMVTGGVIPFIPSSVAKHLEKVPWKKIVDPIFIRDVEKAFDGDPQVMELVDDLPVFRYYGGTSKVQGSPWFSLNDIPLGDARQLLALPNGNLASNVAEFTIPKDTLILVGPAANQTLDPSGLFEPYATGGGIQIYLPDPTIARLK